MDFRVLGPVEVRAEDGPREVHGRKELAVLAYLLVHLGRTVSADELITAVWGEDAPPGAQKSLHVRLSHLRGDLGDGGALIQRDGGGYRLAAAPADLDAHRFAQRVTAAAELPPEEALAAYDRALAELRGRPYADVADLDFVHGETRRLDELRLRAIDGRLRALLALGRHDEALPELDRRVREEPLHEGLATLHMLALYRAGRQVEALEAYRALAHRLDELGLEPSEEARELERRILLQDPGLAGPAPGGTNLGVRLTSFVGRDAERAELLARLRAHRLVSVTGPGGVGKTSLAAEAGRALLDEFPDGVWAVELAPLREPAEIPGAIAAAVGVAGGGLDPGAAGSALDVVRDHLRDRRALLVLDNCEHLADAAGQVAERLLAAAPSLRVLATSRHRLGAAGEAIVELDPFPVPPPDATARRLEAFDCARLFVERAQTGRPGFALDEHTSGPVASICARLDGLPLAIELAAARLRALPVDEIAARLDDRFAVLAGAKGGGGRTLAGVVEWSYNLLTGDEQALFRRLAVFRGPFTLDAAETVATGERLRRERIADLLAALVDRSMVRADGGAYHVLHTLAAFGEERLAECDERDDVVARHAELFARRGRAAALRLWSAGVDGVLEGLWPLREDLVAAEGEVPAATALALMDYQVGDTESARRRLEAALAQRDAHPRDTLAALRIHAIQLLLEGRLEAGTEAAEAAQLLAPETGDDAERDRTAAVVGLALMLARDHEGALAAFAGLEERCAARGEHWSVGFVAGWCGFIALQQGGLADARELSRRAVEAFERCGDLWGFLTACVNLGRSCLALDANDEAAAVIGDALAAAEGRIGDRVLPLLHDLGLAEARRGRLDAAAEHWARCTEAADRDLGTTGGWVMLTAAGLRWYPLMGAGHLARLHGRPDEAARRYGEARAVLEQLEAQAREPLGLPLAATMTLLLQARLAEDAGQAGEAVALARGAVQRALAARDPRLVARALDGLAAGLALGEDPGEAAELLGLAAATRDRAGGPLPAGDQADLERVVARLREQLGGELDAAIERGRERDLVTAA